MKYVFLLLFIPFSFAGPGHDHKHKNGHAHSHKAVSKEKTVELGKSQIQRLIKAGKIDPSWKNALYEKSVKKKKEWLVTFNNENGVKGKKLYIFLKLSGDFVAANFTGK